MAKSVAIPREAWERFNDAVDDIGWTDMADVEAFNFAVHRGFQSLRALLLRTIDREA